MLKRFIEEEDGQGLVEYGLLMSLITLVTILALTKFTQVAKNSFNRTVDSLDTSSNN